METEIIPKYILEHFADDKKSFAGVAELMKKESENMTCIRGNLIDVKNILIKNAEDTIEHRNRLDEHIARVEPVIRAYEEAKIAERLNAQLGDKMLRVGKYVTTATILGGAIIYIIRKFI